MTSLQVSAQKQLRQLVEQIERLEEEAILAVYMHALGMIDEAAAPRVMDEAEDEAA
jgi:uncharacterized protein (UPF0335 family)